jgi:hypothetical protein
MNKKELLISVESLRNILISRATGGFASEIEYKRHRERLLKSGINDKLIPRFLKTCSDLSQFWGFIKARYSTYQERREFIWQDFSVLIEDLEKPEYVKKIFLSHSSKDKFFARRLAEGLRINGIDVWIDEAEIKIGDSLTEKIGKAIETTQYFGVILSENSINSEWVKKELQIAIQKELASKKVVVLPILLEPVEIPSFLKDKLYADFTNSDNFDSEFSKILDALSVSPTKRHTYQIAKREIVKEKSKEIKVEFTKAEKALMDFDDIKIVEIDDNRSYKPDERKALYNVYLKLSNQPTSEWQQIFEAERKFPRHTMWRRAWIEGKHIVIHCGLEEIEKYHLNDLQEDVNNSNKKYRDYLTEMARKESKEVLEKKSEKDKLLEIKRKLNL